MGKKNFFLSAYKITVCSFLITAITIFGFSIQGLCTNIVQTYSKNLQIESGQECIIAMDNSIPTGMNNSRYAVKNFTSDAEPENIFGFMGGAGNSEFNLFKGMSMEKINLPNTGEDSLYTIAVISDPHTDYGIQGKEPYIRQGMIDACAQIRENENPNVLLVAGDLTSINAGEKGWSKEIYDRAIAAIHSAAMSATESGRVLYATGNHDFAVGGKEFNSGDYTQLMLDTAGEFKDSLYQENSKFPHMLGYHYVIDGIDFVVINTPYNGDDNHGNYVYNPASIDWLDNTLGKLDSNNPVFVMSHYPFRDSRNISGASKGMAEDYDGNFKNVLLKYPNVIYLYGHDHGGAKIQYDTFERVTPYGEDGSVVNSRTEVPTGFVSFFAGSMGYYIGALDARQPEVVQALIIDIYSDQITFSMKNYGVSDAGADVPLSYSIPRAIKTLSEEDSADMIDTVDEDAVLADINVPTSEESKEKENSIALLVTGTIFLVAAGIIGFVLFKTRKFKNP